MRQSRPSLPAWLEALLTPRFPGPVSLELEQVAPGLVACTVETSDESIEADGATVAEALWKAACACSWVTPARRRAAQGRKGLEGGKG